MEKGNKDCPGEKRVTHEANHVVKQQRLLLKKKERKRIQDFTCQLLLAKDLFCSG